LTDEQRSDFLTRASQVVNRGTGEFNNPKLRHSKGQFGDTEVHHVRDYMKKVHGVNLHPFSVADTMYNMTTPLGHYGGYHGTPLGKLRQSFTKEKSRQRTRSSWAPPGTTDAASGLVRTPLKGRSAAARRASKKMAK
jgi:hypothetical protein